VHKLVNPRTMLSVVATALFMGGCASNDAIQRAQTTADQALQEARQAQSTATSAQQSADQAKSMIEQHEQNSHRKGQRG
jgi:PBP1b-binding outer membrane lipoprotein LpoB